MKKFALIGCGDVARWHAKNILQYGSLEAVCDNNMERVAGFIAEFGGRACSSLEGLLFTESKIDIVVICTPTGCHAEHIIKSLQAHKHVLCESPLCLTAAAAWQVMETEKFCQRKIFLVNELQYHSPLQQLHRLLKEEVFGKILDFKVSCMFNYKPDYFDGWRGNVFPGGGLLYQPFYFYIGAIGFLFGQVEAVNGSVTRSGTLDCIEFEDAGRAALKMKNGIQGAFNWMVSTKTKDTVTTFEINTEKGAIKISGENLSEIVYPQVDVKHQPDIPLTINSIKDSSLQENFYTDLYKQVINRSEKNVSSSTCLEVLPALEIIEAIYKSATNTNQV